MIYQFNVAQMKYPKDAPDMQSFFNAVPQWVMFERDLFLEELKGGLLNFRFNLLDCVGMLLLVQKENRRKLGFGWLPVGIDEAFCLEEVRVRKPNVLQGDLL